MKPENYYQIRINKALAYINKHLTDEINTTTLAKASGFSTYHFQRLYKAIQNETPYETLLRLRLEKSIFLLQHRKHLKIIDIALESGFPSIENFSRQFKTRYKVTASEFKKNSKIYQENTRTHVDNENTNTNKDFTLTIEKLNAIPIIFIRALFGQDGSPLLKSYDQLIKWAKQNNINYQGKLTRFGMSIDNPEVTPKKKYRYDFALKTNQNIKAEGLFEQGQIPAGDYATLHVKGDITKVSQAWNYLYKKWLPNSQYTPKHYPAIEEFIQGPEQIGWETFNIKCRVPLIKRK